MTSLVDTILEKLLKVIIEKLYKSRRCNGHNWIALSDQRWYKSIHNNLYNKVYYRILRALEYTPDKQGTVYWCEIISYSKFGVSVKQDYEFCCDLMGSKCKPVSQEEYETFRQMCLNYLK